MQKIPTFSAPVGDDNALKEQMAKAKQFAQENAPNGGRHHQEVVSMKTSEMGRCGNVAAQIWNQLLHQGYNRVEMLMIIAVLILQAQESDGQPDEVVEFTLRHFRVAFRDAFKTDYIGSGDN